MWFFNKFVFYKPNDLLLGALIGGLGFGIGASIVFTNNTTSGGSDIIARLIQKNSLI